MSPSPAAARRRSLQVAREIERLGRRALAHACDVVDPASVDGLFAAVEKRLRPARPAVQQRRRRRAGGAFEALTYEQWKAVVDVNLNGAFLARRAPIALMKRQRPQGGRIINNGSISAHAPRPMSAPYTATKHAISGLTKSIALDGRAFDIACGQIDIGNAETEMTERMAEGVLQADGRVAVEPTIDAAEVGAAIVHMASLPLSSNVLSMTLMATKMPFVGRANHLG